MTRIAALLVCLTLFAVTLPIAHADKPAVSIRTPMAPPAWALMERELLRANTAACREFFNKYFDERGFLLCVERWGGDDGPDDAIENCNDWPILHALGASNEVLRMTDKAWEGHLRQFTLAKTTDVPFAREGMYFKEFPVMFDWLHNGEGLTVFNLMGLSNPYKRQFGQRTRRYAGFYMNEDPGAANYDPEHKIIRSLFNGSRGPLLRKATGLDWAGDPIVVKGRFHLGHGEETYQQMLDHFKDYNDIVGDHPANLQATTLAMNAYMLTGQEKYKTWLLEYVDAWLERMEKNGGIIPTNIGLNGKIGGETDGKWYGGVYGWGFTVVVPQNGSLAHRSTFQHGFTGFMNAAMLTGDMKYIEAWRKQAELVNANKKVVDGRTLYPSMFGDKGWYNFTTKPYGTNALERFYMSWNRDNLKWGGGGGWLAYLDGKNPGFAEAALKADFANIRKRVQGMRADTTTPDTRLSDDPMKFNPASVRSLIHLMMGGIHPGHRGSIILCRLRYFDPIKRRAGVPQDVAALVERMTDDETTVTLVNTSQLASRQVVVQAGGYGEHQFVSVVQGGKEIPINGSHFTVHLAPGAGQRLTLKMKRYVNQPTMHFPWNQ